MSIGLIVTHVCSTNTPTTFNLVTFKDFQVTLIRSNFLTGSPMATSFAAFVRFSGCGIIYSLFIDSGFIYSGFIYSGFIYSVFIDSVFIDSVFIDSVFIDSVFIDSVFIDSGFVTSGFGFYGCFFGSISYRGRLI